MRKVCGMGIKVKFETAECRRCGGTGQYPSSAWNGICLGCNGSGVKLTRRGLAARKAYDAVMEGMNVPASAIVPRDHVKFSGRKWAVVESINPDGGIVTSLMVNGERKAFQQIVINTSTCSYHIDRDSPIMRWDADVYRSAAVRVSNMSGATVTGLNSESDGMGGVVRGDDTVNDIMKMLNNQPTVKQLIDQEKSDRVATSAPVVSRSARIDHSACGHERTPKGRAACRKARGN